MVRSIVTAYLASTFIVFASTEVFAQEQNGKKSALTPTCATPVRIKTLDEPKILPCSIEVVEPSHVYQSRHLDLNLGTSDAETNLYATVRSNLRPMPGLNSSGGLDDVTANGSQPSRASIPKPIVDLRTESVELLLAELLPAEIETKYETAAKPDIDTADRSSIQDDLMLRPMSTVDKLAPSIPTNHDVDTNEGGVEEAETENSVNEHETVGQPLDENGQWQSTKLLPIAQSSSTESTDRAEERDVVMNFSDATPQNESIERQSVVEANIDTKQLPELVENVKTESLVIHPPMLQPYNRNQHTFVIENTGSNSASNVSIEIKVPESARIVASLPVNSVFSPSTAVFRFEEISAGEKVQVHLTAVEKSKNPITFVASISAKSTYEFGVVKDHANGELNSVSYNMHSADYPSDQYPESRAAALIRNPYVGGVSKSAMPTQQAPPKRW